MVQDMDQEKEVMVIAVHQAHALPWRDPNEITLAHHGVDQVAEPMEADFIPPRK
jgi:hypothetical protein